MSQRIAFMTFGVLKKGKAKAIVKAQVREAAAMLGFAPPPSAPPPAAFSARWPPVKQRDAIAVLEALKADMSAAVGQGRCAPVQVENTVFLEALRNEVRLSLASEVSLPPLAIRPLRRTRGSATLGERHSCPSWRRRRSRALGSESHPKRFKKPQTSSDGPLACSGAST
jgi:hypothetical protein